MTDVAYFLGWCMNKEERRNVEHDLLKNYWSILRRNGIREYSFEQLMLDCRYSLLRTLQILISSLVNLDLTSERWDMLVTAMLERLGASLEDHDVAALLT